MELIWLVAALSALTQPSHARAQGGQLSEIFSFDNVLFSECQAFVKTCPPTRTNCASGYCSNCAGFGTKIKSCCAQATPASCFAGLGNGAVVSSPATVSAITTQGSSGGARGACDSLTNAYAACEAQTPGFSDLADSSAASCLCYSSSSWAPDVYDGFVSTCASSASALGDLSDYSTLASLENFCRSVGNVRNAGAGAGATATATATNAATNAASSAGGAGTGTGTSQAQTGATVTSSGPMATATATTGGVTTTTTASAGAVLKSALSLLMTGVTLVLATLVI